MMKVFVYVLLLFNLLLVTIACQNNNTQNTDNTTEVNTAEADPSDEIPADEPEPVDPRKAIFLQSLYATSTDSEKPVNNILDDNPETIWQTRLGAGPDEGIMLSFLPGAENYIQRLELDFAEGPGLAKVNDAIIYVNGQPLYFFNGADTLAIDTFVNVLFIRIGSTAEMNLKEDTEGDFYRSVNRFSPNHAVGVASLRLYDMNGEPYKVVAPKIVKGDLLPSSNLNPVVAYHAGMLFDGRKEFAWVEGSEGSGREDSINIRVEEPLSLTDIQMWNGYQRSPLHYKSNARIKQFSFGLKGETPGIYDLEDEMFSQSIRLDTTLKGQEFVLKIMDVYPGRSYSDLAISELLFFEGAQPIIVESGLARQFQEECISQSNGTVLENLLDRRIYSETEAEAEVYEQQSLILRSNGTFVTYQREFSIDTDVDAQTLADGNWQILEADEQKARVKIFGQMTNLSELEAYYLGVSKNEFSRIFNDVLEIYPDRIEGNRFLGTYYVE